MANNVHMPTAALHSGVAERLLPGENIPPTYESLLRDRALITRRHQTGDWMRVIEAPVHVKLLGFPSGGRQPTWLITDQHLFEASFRRVVGCCICEALIAGFAHVCNYACIITFYDHEILLDLLEYIVIRSREHLASSGTPQFHCDDCAIASEIAREVQIRRVYAGYEPGTRILDGVELRLLSRFLVCVMDRLGFVAVEDEGPSTGCAVQHIGRMGVCEDVYIVSEYDENSYVGPAIVVEDFLKQEVWPDTTEAGAEHFPMMFHSPPGRDAIDERVERSLNLIRVREIIEQLADPYLQDTHLEPPELIEDSEDEVLHPAFKCIVC
jgi:hypothetical protein